MEQLRTAVIGAGKMGAIHARIYSQMPECHLVAVVDSDSARARALADRFACKACADVREILDHVDAVTLATPTVTHMVLARPLLERRIPILIEKPLAATVREGRTIVDLARRSHTVVAVGHSERCNPVIQAIKGQVVSPRLIEAVRVSPYPFRSTDVGVVLDVMIHDIDIILSLVPVAIRRIEAIGRAVIGPTEDLCKARITFADGCIADLTASRLALQAERGLRVFTPQAYWNIDYLTRSGTVVRAGANQDGIRWIRDRQAEGGHDFSQVKWSDLVRVEPLAIRDLESIRLEQEAFLRAVRDRSSRPEVTAEEGLAALECALKIVDRINRPPRPLSS